MRLQLLSMLIIGLFSAGSASARGNMERVYEGWLDSGIYEYFNAIQFYDKSNDFNGPASCHSDYQHILNKGSMEIRYALGYFDESEANSHNDEISPAMDGAAYRAIYKRLTRPCYIPYENVALCGFQATGSADSGQAIFSKEVQLFGQPIDVHIYLTQASASVSYEQNRGPLKALQEQRTARSEENFFGGFETADIVFYNGHARDGGGPDFQPPVLRKSDLHPNYDGYYKVKKEGFNNMLAALRNSSVPQQRVGLFACYTEQHFAKKLLETNPKLKLILSNDKPDYTTATVTSMGFLEGFLRGDCGESLSARAKQTFSSQRKYLEINF